MATALTPAQAWSKLKMGNERFVSGVPAHPNQDLGRRALTAVTTQEPFAAIFGCMDSRVAAEIIFDRGLGDLAVIRTAGHIVDNAVLGSLEFGVVGLGIPLVVVLGHDSCGAINAAVTAHSSGEMPRGYLRDVVERLTSSFVTTRSSECGSDAFDARTVMEEHVRHTVRLISERSSAIAERIADGRCAVVGADYRLAEGHVQLISYEGDLGTVIPV